MAIVTVTVSQSAPVVPPAKAAPTVSELVPINGARLVLLDMDNGATPSTVTVTRAGTEPSGGGNRAPLVVVVGASSRSMVVLTSDMADANGNVAVGFSSVATLTHRVLYFF